MVKTVAYPLGTVRVLPSLVKDLHAMDSEEILVYLQPQLYGKAQKRRGAPRQRSTPNGRPILRDVLVRNCIRLHANGLVDIRHNIVFRSHIDRTILCLHSICCHSSRRRAGQDPIETWGFWNIPSLGQDAIES